MRNDRWLINKGYGFHHTSEYLHGWTFKTNVTLSPKSCWISNTHGHEILSYNGHISDKA